jgi:hypothetical protein
MKVEASRKEVLRVPVSIVVLEYELQYAPWFLGIFHATRVEFCATVIMLI